MKRVIIMGAGGRDFHNFNTVFRNNPDYEVVCFTAEQIPNIEKRIYPRVLAGKRYPKGIPIYLEGELPKLIKKHKIDLVVLAYSDLSNQEVMDKASLVLSMGADFCLLGPESTMLKSKKPVISVCAVRTGAGKSPTTRFISHILAKNNIHFAIIRHPMPYGNLEKEIVQKFSSYEDLKKHKCTIEEIEEYEPHIKNGFTVFAGADYEKILREAEKEADVILWDGGNNDFPFFRPDMHIVIADARRPGHEMTYYPGETNTRMADVVVINKIKSSKKEDIRTVENNVKSLNPTASIIKSDMRINVDSPELIKNKSVLVIGDGPTITHGGLSYGAGYMAAKMFGAREIIDPRKYAIGSIKEVYNKYPHIGRVLPAIGYGREQIAELEKTINRVKCDSVIIGTPVDLARYIKINKPFVKVTYELEEIGKPVLENITSRFIKKFVTKSRH